MTLENEEKVDSRFKKKKPYGNKHTRKAQTLLKILLVRFLPSSSFVDEEMQTSVSSRKLEESVFTSASLPETHGNNEIPFHYVIIVIYLNLDWMLLGKRPTCHQKKLIIHKQHASKKGLANFLEISCKDCNFVYSTYTSSHSYS